jgi:hypothetical protein
MNFISAIVVLKVAKDRAEIKRARINTVIKNGGLERYYIPLMN